MESEWCEKEIAEASVKQIGIIQAIWPNHRLERMAEVCFPYTLSDSNFLNGIYDNKDTSKLNDETINNLVNQVESIRPRNLASRQDNLITEVLNSARKYGKNVTIQPKDSSLKKSIIIREEYLYLQLVFHNHLIAIHHQN